MAQIRPSLSHTRPSPPSGAREARGARHKPAVLAAIALVLLAGSAFYPPAEPAMTVVIDAGHGGRDPGNLGTGRYKMAEKDITLAVAKKTAAYIEERIPGVRVIMTRTNDTYPELSERVRIANDAEADLLLSIHCDSFQKSSVTGSSTFVMGLDKSEASLRVAAKENAAVYEETDARGFDPDDPDTFIALALKQEIYLGRSLQLAELIQTQFRERVGRKDRGVRQAPYYVTAYSNMPSVLVELGFLTNPKEEDFLHSEQGQDYMSSALFRAFRDYAKQWFSLEAAVQDVESPDPKPDAGESNADRQTDSTETSASTEGMENTEGAGNGQEAETEAAPTPPAWHADLSAGCDGAICFSVQAASNRRGGPLTGPAGWGVPHTVQQQIGAVHKYRVGSTDSYAEACRMRDTLRKNGFPDAFVVAFEEGSRIPLETALKKAKG
jgi:N-acetylmuramoyl-L-alanine amidase